MTGARLRLSLLGTILCSTFIAGAEVVSALSDHIGKTSALVIAVCGTNPKSAEAVARLVGQTPWMSGR